MASIQQLIASHRVHAGPRYVFFQSLASETSFSYPRLYKQGMGYVAQASAALHPDSNSNSYQADLARIKAYIDFIGQLADKETENELAFMQSFKDILSGIEDSELGEKMLNFLNGIENNNIGDYPKFLAVLNTIMTNNSDFAKKRQAAARDSMAFIDKIYGNADQEIRDEIVAALNSENYSVYQKNIRQLMPETQIDYDRKFSSTISYTFAKKYNSILGQVANDPDLITQLVTAWQSNKDITADCKGYIVATIMKYLESLSFEELTKFDARDFIKNINIKDFEESANQMTDEYINNVVNLLNKKKVVDKTLEEIALTTRRGLGDQFLKLTSDSQKTITNNYAQYGFDNQTLQSILQRTQNYKKQAALITEKLGKAIRERAQKEWHMKNVFNKYEKQYLDEIQKEIKEKGILKKLDTELKQRVLDPKKIANNLQLKITGPASAEEMVNKELSQLSNSDLQILVGGGQIKLKGDVVFSFSGNIELNDIFKGNDILQNAIKDTSQKFNENFLKNIHDKIGDKVIASLKIESYEDTMRDLRDEIKDEISNFYSGDELEQKVTQTLEQLNNLINGGIQVKDYAYGSSLGFMGGSLGLNGAQILENIDTMYNVGGISRIDYELLYFVLANCGADGIANELKDDLATYLLGGAMMLLFDDGFTAAQAFLDRVTKQFGFAPKTVHLFNLQGGHYIPASFVYNSIYNNLLVVYSDIASQVSERTTISTSEGSSQIHIENNITAANIPDWHDIHKAQDRWDTVKNMTNAKENIDIKITFLAGILDMFDAIPQAFSAA